MINNTVQWKHSLLLSALTVLSTTNSYAQNPTDKIMQIEEVVVTARKKSESLQDVPISITAFTGSDVLEMGLSDTLSIDEKTPNLEIKTFGGQPNIFIRGVGNNDFNATTVSPVSLYVDEVVMGLTGAQTAQLFDVQRIEVLRGPQGTLFGRNTTGGAIAFYSNTPSEEFEAGARVSLGSYKQRDIETYISGPLSDNISARVAAISSANDGDRINDFNGSDANAEENHALRVVFNFNPTDTLQLNLNLHGGVDRSDFKQGKPRGTNAFGYTDPHPNDKKRLNFNAKSQHYGDTHGFSLTANWDLGGAVLKSITAFEKANTDYCGDIDHSPTSLDEICFITDGEQFTQEINISSEIGEKSSVVAGVFVLSEELENLTEANLFGDAPAESQLPTVGYSSRDTNTYAIYSELNYQLNAAWQVTGGLRYTYEEKEATVRSDLIPNYYNDQPNGAPIALVPEEDLSESWGAVSGRIAVDFQPNDDVLIYGSISRGFKSGGFNLGSFFDPNEVTAVDPEYLIAYELGSKSTFFDKRLRANGAVFYYDYSELQVFTFVSGSTPTTPVVFALENAADAKVYGAELELKALLSSKLSADFGLGYLKTEYKNFTSSVGGDLSGNSLPGSPEFNINASITYDVGSINDWEVKASLDYSYTDKRYFNAFEDDEISSLSSHSLLGARISADSPSQKWKVAIWGRNLNDEVYIVDSTDLRGNFGFVPEFYGDRRSFGIDFSYSY